MSARKREPGSKRITMGMVADVLPGAIYKVRLGDGGEITAYVSAKRSRLYSSISPGDWVRVERFPHAPDRGRIVRRRRPLPVAEPVGAFLKRLLGREPR
jgi:translation initiation factor IF-1